MKVLFYNHSAEMSGAEISLLLTIAHLKRVEAILVAPVGELLETAKQRGISVRPVQSYRARMSRSPVQLLRGLLGTIRAGWELRRVLIREKPDVVHANSIRAGLICTVAVWGRHVRVCWHVRDTLSSNGVGIVIRGIASIFASHVFVISNDLFHNFSNTRVLARKTTIVHNGIEVNVAEATPGALRRDLGTRSDCFVVGVVGQIAEWKRQHDGIEAFADLHAQAKNTELWIVGEPKFNDRNKTYEQDLRLQVERLGLVDCVRFLGFRKDIMNVMTSLDVLLLPSDREPFGRVIIEAMLAGKPVVGTNAGGVPDIVLPRETGLLVNVGDVAAMARSLHELRADVALKMRMGQRGRQRVLERFTLERVVDTLESVYELQGRQRSPSRTAAKEVS